MAESFNLRDTPERRFRAAQKFFQKKVEVVDNVGIYDMDLQVCERLNCDRWDDKLRTATRNANQVHARVLDRDDVYEITDRMTSSEWEEKAGLLDLERYIQLIVKLYAQLQYPEPSGSKQNMNTFVTLIKEMT